jgi:hypothetical protein
MQGTVWPVLAESTKWQLHFHVSSFGQLAKMPSFLNELTFLFIAESPTLDVFAAEMKLGHEEMARMGTILAAIVSGENSGLTPNEAADFRFFVQKLQETGFF